MIDEYVLYPRGRRAATCTRARARLGAYYFVLFLLFVKKTGFVAKLGPLFTHTGDGDTIRPGHVANDYNPPVPPQAGPALRPDGDDVTPDPGL